jgi:hypothetical protein
MEVTEPVDDLKIVFLEAARQAADERAKAQAELLSSGKLQVYIKNTLKYMAKELMKLDSYDFMLISYHDVDCPEAVFMDYAATFVAIAGEFGIKANITGTHIRIDKPSLKKVFEGLVPPPPPPDMSTLREMLRQGPYR